MNNIKNKLNFIWRSLRAARLSLIDLQYSISPINYAVLETFYMNVLDFEKHYVSDMIDIHARNSVIQLYEICYGKLSLNKVINEIILNAESLNLTDKIQDMKASQKELKKIQNKYKI